MRRFALVVFVLSVVLAVAALCVPAHGTHYRHMYDWVSNRYGQAVSGASVYVYGANTTTAATIYSDLAGGTAASNPLTTDADGYWSCYIDPATRVDVRIYHAALGIDNTIANWGATGSNADTTDISSASGDFTVSGTVTADTLMLTKSGTDNNATLRFGSDTDTSAKGTIWMPKSHSLWIRGTDSKSRAGTGFQYCMAFGQNELQMEPNTALSWVVPDSGGWSDRAFILPDTSTGSHYDVLKWQSTRTDSTDWTVGKVRSGPAKGGLPLYAGRFYTNMPDSASAGGNGVRTGFRIQWANSNGRNTGVNNDESRILSLVDGDTEVYMFQKGGLVLYPSHDGEEKGISWTGGGGTTYTQITEVDGGYTHIKANSGKLKITTEAVANTAKLYVHTTLLDDLRLTPMAAGARDTVGARIGTMRFTTGDSLIVFGSGRTWLTK
jgi:hypothetical protein